MSAFNFASRGDILQHRLRSQESDNRRRCNAGGRLGERLKAEACQVLDFSTAQPATATVTAVHLVDCGFNISHHRNARKPA